MTSPILQLGADEVLRALHEINPIDGLIDELIGRAIDPEGWRRQRNGRLTLRPAARATTGGPVTDMVLLEDGHTGTRSVLPASVLRSVRVAALATVAARELVPSGVLTAAVVGSGLTAQIHLAVSTRHLPHVSHVAFHAVDGGPGAPIASVVREQLELDGIGLTVTGDVDQAVFGANLVIVASAGAGRLRPLTRGAVLVNASGTDLPEDVVESVDQIYVEDLGMLGEYPNRYVVRMHLGGTGRTVADLGHLLTGRHSPRRRAGDVVLVELLTVDVLDEQLAGSLCSAALRLGIGAWLVE